MAYVSHMAVHKPIEATCARCGETYFNLKAWAGHCALHGFADRYTGGDLAAAGELLSKSGNAYTDPTPTNGAFRRGHEFLAAHAREDWVRQAARRFLQEMA